MFNKKSFILVALYVWCLIFTSTAHVNIVKENTNVTQHLTYRKLKQSIVVKNKLLGLGYFGFAVQHIEKRQGFAFNSDKFFPMASTYKLQIAAYCLHLVDNKKLSLQKKYVVKSCDLRRVCFISQNQRVSISELIKLMIEKSGNASTDIILKIVGGPRAVNVWLNKNGFKNMNVARSVLEMLSDYNGVRRYSRSNPYSLRKDIRLVNRVKIKDRTNAINKFYEDKRDTTTSVEMVNFLSRLFRKRLLSQRSTDFLLQTMLKWGKGRIRRLLPKSTRVWHKTGSMDNIISDVGIIELPNKKGHLAVAFYTNKSTISSVIQEKMIAEISKLLFDYFSFAYSSALAKS